MDLSSKIEGYLEVSGRSQKDLAKSIGVVQSLLSSWITGERDPWGMRLRTAKKLAEEMNTTLDALAKEEKQVVTEQ